MCYYFNDIIKLENFNFDNILIDEKSHKNTLICNISRKPLIGAKPLRIRFDKIDGFIRIYDENRHLVLYGLEKYGVIYKRIGYLKVKIAVSYMFFLTIMQKPKLILIILCL